MFFHAPRSIYGINCFRMFMDEMGGGVEAVSRYLGIHENTVRRWLREETPVPRAAVLAMFWESKYGRSQIFTDQVNEIRLLYQRVCLLQEQYQQAKDIITGLRAMHAGSANEPLFEEMPTFPLPAPPTINMSDELPAALVDASELQQATGTASSSPRARKAMQAFERTRLASEA